MSEIERKSKCAVQMKGSQTVLTATANAESRSKSARSITEGSKTFAFDHSYWSFDRNDDHYTGQADVFNDLGQPLLENAFKGYNNCIFAYGQTGSGKSYSMMGFGEETGIIPRICCSMFEQIERCQSDKNLKCTVEVSYLEIYNERVRDLLNPATKGNLKVREHPSTGPYVEDLASLVVRSFEEVENLMDEGNKARTVAATNMNETSSRSHAVFTLTLTQRRHDDETNVDTEKVAKISLVDLAGSERATSTGATGARLKEGAEINRSLSSLGRVIAALADLSTGKKKNASIIPYRDSVLTWLLKDSLGGNSLTAMIAAISPADINYEETLSTLRYADSAKRIKNHAVVNEDPNARMIRELKAELAQLRSKLSVSDPTSPDSEGHMKPAAPLEQQFVSITQSNGDVKQVSKAEIVEQLSQSEKLYKDLNQTWEEKLIKTEKIQREREAALEELGISIEKNFVGLSTPKKMPHLVNLSDDPLLAECLVYNLKPGTTSVGNANSTESIDIRLNGSKIHDCHCIFTNMNDTVNVTPEGSASVLVNGAKIDKSKRLRSGYRIIIGDFHIFRFNNPQEARAERAEQTTNDERRSSLIDGNAISSLSIRPTTERLRSTNKIDFENSLTSSKTVSPTSPEKEVVDGAKLKAQDEDSHSSLDVPKTQITKETNVVNGSLLGHKRNSSSIANRPKSSAANGTGSESTNSLALTQNASGSPRSEPLAQERSSNSIGLSEKEVKLATHVMRQWRQLKYISMIEDILKNVALLKEAQIVSNLLHKDLHFQFTIVDKGSLVFSSYDMVLNRIADDGNDDLDIKLKPCVAVRVINFRNCVVNVWSMERLSHYVRLMRQIHQYSHNPEYLQHLKIENDTSDPSLPSYTHTGNADVPLAAVFDLRVRDLNVEVISPFTFAVIGMLKLSLEPSSLQGISGAFGFNVILHEMTGFTEREGTDVHAQIFLLGSNEDGGASTTQQINGFDERPLQFGSVHSLRVPKPSQATPSLRVSIFSRVTNVHLEKLVSWDNVRDSQLSRQSTSASSRLPESAYIAEEQHDLFVRIQILEISEVGEYLPTEVMHSDSINDEVFHLRQGLQRRVKVKLIQNSSRTWAWEKTSGLTMGRIRLLDSRGMSMQVDAAKPDVSLKVVSQPVSQRNADGTTEIAFISQWDSSAHESVILDKVTADNYYVQGTLSWQVPCDKAIRPSLFSIDLTFKIRSRYNFPSTSLLSHIWKQSRVRTSKPGNFIVKIRPASINRLGDIWRTKKDVYVNGEEVLSNWAPRMATLVEDYLSSLRRYQRAADMESAQSLILRQTETLDRIEVSQGKSIDRRQEDLLRHVLRLWQSPSATGLDMLKAGLDPPKNFGQLPTEPSELSVVKVSVSVQLIRKNPTILKSGYVMMPDRSSTRWLKRFIELRIPYLHIYSVSSGEEINAISLTHSRIDHQPQIERILSPNVPSIFAVYAPHNSYLFFTRCEKEKVEWIVSINQVYCKNM